MLVRAAVAIAAALLLAPPAQAAWAQTAPPDASPISLERVGRFLQQPALNLSEKKPDFSVRISETATFRDIYGEGPLRREAPSVWNSYFKPIAGQQGAVAGASIDVLAVAMSLKNRIQAAMRHRAEREIREQIQQELEEFCRANGCTPPTR